MRRTQNKPHRTITPKNTRKRRIEDAAFKDGAASIKVTAPVTAANDNSRPLTDAEKFKVAEPILPDIMHAMNLAEKVGEANGRRDGRIDGLKLPRTYGERVAQDKLPAIDAVMAEVRRELVKAYTKFPPGQASPHESYAVLLEEADELWDEIKADRGRMASGRKEGVQVAAMAVRYLVDINPQ